MMSYFDKKSIHNLKQKPLPLIHVMSASESLSIHHLSTVTTHDLMHGRILSVSVQEQAQEEFVTYIIKIKLGFQLLFIILNVGSLPNH